MTQVETRLAESGQTLPPAPAAAANYVPWTRVGDTIYVSGQIPMVDGELQATGKVGPGGDHALEQGQEIAAICARNIIAVLKAAAEEAGKTLDDVRVARISCFVNCAPGFTDIHLVANGASDVIRDAFAANGVHARSAVGMAELPLDVPVEVEAIGVLS